MVILLSFGTKVFEKDVLEYFRPVGISQQKLEAVPSKCEIWYKVWYQMVPGTILMVILQSFSTKVFKKDVLEYGFPLLEYQDSTLESRITVQAQIAVQVGKSRV